jgi:hypothetical protein
MRTDQGELLFTWSQPPGKGFFVGESTGEEFVCELRAWLPGKPCPMCQPYEKKLEYKTRIQNSNTKLEYKTRPPKKVENSGGRIRNFGFGKRKSSEKTCDFRNQNETFFGNFASAGNIIGLKVSSETSRPPDILLHHVSILRVNPKSRNSGLCRR